jgi:hypothetical protein
MARVVLGCDVEIEAGCECGTVYSVDAEAVGVRMGPCVCRCGSAYIGCVATERAWKRSGEVERGESRVDINGCDGGYGGYCGENCTRRQRRDTEMYAASHGVWEEGRGCSGWR